MQHILSLVILLCFVSNFLHAQCLDTPIYSKDKQIASYYVLPKGVSLIKRNWKSNEKISQISQLLKLNNETTLVLCDTLKDIAGGYHDSYYQMYKGLIVEGAKCVVHYDKRGISRSITGNLCTIDNLQVVPHITESQSNSIVFETMRKDNSLSFFSQHGINVLIEDSLVKVQKGTLVVYMSDGMPYLAYKHQIKSAIKSLNKQIYIDALNGVFLGEYTSICDIFTNVTTLFSGSRCIVSQYQNGLYVLKDNTRGNGIMTCHSDGTDYQSSDNTWSNLSIYDRAAIDAHWGAETTYDFYYNKFGRNSYDNCGSSIVSLVNVMSNSNGILTDWPNASWNMNAKQMSYGRYYNGNPMTSLDISAHELTHGVTQHTSGLVYEKESGAINEGISDVFAVCVENEYKPGNDIWRMGEDVCMGGLRNLANPTCKYYHGSGWADTNQIPTEFNDYCGVHTNSGVFAYWFYLLSTGGPGTNESGLNYPVLGIGLDKAIQICYLMNASYLTSNATYYDAKISSYMAAQALGYGDSIIRQLRNAWIDVGVESPDVNINGSHLISNSGIYSINNLPTGYSVVWSLSDSYYDQNCLQQDYPSQGQCIITRNNSYDMMDATLSAKIVCNGDTVKTLVKTGMYAYADFKGNYTSGSITGTINYTHIFSVKQGFTTYITSPNLKGATVSYDRNLTISSIWGFDSTIGSILMVVPSGSNYPTIPVVIYVDDICGNHYQLYAFPVNPNAMSIANGDHGITITLNNPKVALKSVSYSKSWTLEVYGASTGRKMFAKCLDGNSATLSTLGWPKGMYVIKAIVGDELYAGKVMIK